MGLDWIHQGGPLMYALIACSVVSVTITIERLIFWVRFGREQDGDLFNRVRGLVSQGRRDEAAALCAGSRDATVRVCRYAFEHPQESLEAALRMGANEEVRRMGRYLRIHDTIITLAPLLGILGTVLGIISTFEVLGGGRIDNPVAVTGGIAEALVTTAAGLAVAMISLVPYNYFTARLERAVGELEGHLTSFEIAFRQARGTRAS